MATRARSRFVRSIALLGWTLPILSCSGGGAGGAPAVAPTVTTQPASQTVAAGGTAVFSVAATGSAPLAYQWAHGGSAIAGATSPTLTLTDVRAASAGSYAVVVSNGGGSVTSDTATLTVTGSSDPLAAYALSGFATVGTPTTGGGQLAETDAGYRKVTTPLELANAVLSANKGTGVKVIEIMNDLDLGWNEVGTDVQNLSSTPFRSHAAPKLHPRLLVTGVSLVDIQPRNGGLTIFSASGATIRHATFNIKNTSNIIVRNLRFDEMWEWDEQTKGDYDSNDWDFIDIGNGGGTAHHVWIDHCTFTKAYDGAVDIKGGAYAITFSWNKYLGDDGATNPDSFVRQQIAALEANQSAYPMYRFLRTNGFGVEDIAAILQGHDKTHLIGANSLDSTNAQHTVTFHHQWFRNVGDRLPRLRAGNVHNYDIYVDDTDALAARRLRDARKAAMSSADQSTLENTYNFGIPLNGSISTENGAVLVERSAYVDCLWPLRNNQTDPSDSAYTGKIAALDTIYVFHETGGTTTTVRGNSTDPGNPLGPFQAAIIPFSWNLTGDALPYSYATDDPADLPSLLATGAGAGVVTWPKANWLRTSY